LFNKRLLIIAGGFDVANEPVIKYGAMQGKSRARFGKWLLSRAHIVIAVSKSNKREIIKNACVSINKIKLIYNAIPDSKNSQNIVKKNIVLTVGEINKETFKRKGLDRFIAVAKKMPNVQFIHIGKWTDKKGNPSREIIDYVKSISPSNINYLGYVDKKELEKYYEESKIYLQLSRHEAFGISVVEAMSYKCTPIVTNSYALPEIVGRNGFIVQNIDKAILKIQTVLESELFSIDHSLLSKFSIRNRRDKFNQII
jgi:glycosyltransferase involved in cell wall biosynthesis